MKNNCKKGFTLAELLMIFLLISVMLAAFAPLMTRKSQKKVDETCTNGVKSMTVEYTIPGNYTFEAPENITGNSVITLVGAGGRGGNGKIERYTKGEVTYICYATGGGGGGGAYFQSSVALNPGASYDVKVGGGGGQNEYQNDTSFVGNDANLIAQRGANGENGVVEVSGETCTVTGGTGGLGGAIGMAGQSGANGCEHDGEGVGSCTTGGVGGSCSVYAEVSGGTGGEVCSTDDCIKKKHGKPGSDYTRSSLSSLEFISGTGGGGGGVNTSNITAGVGGMGGSGYAKIEYQVRCE